MFCSKCGKEIVAEAAFCSECGSPVTRVIQKKQPLTGSSVRIGFSDRIKDPSIVAMQKKMNRSAGIFFLILIPLPIIATFIVGLVKDDFSYLPVGFVLSAIFLVTNIFSFIKNKAKKSWDGVVTDKKTRNTYERNSNDDERKTYTEYTVVFRDDSGKRRKLTEGSPTNDAHPYYDYLNIGDRVRFHPQFNDFYEKYDKTRDTYLYCAICGKPNDITEEHCKYCNTLLIK